MSGIDSAVGDDVAHSRSCVRRRGLCLLGGGTPVWRLSAEAKGIGALMNARGLMEIVLLNIALQRGVITETTYAMLVMMALATTLMPYPLFDLVWRSVPAEAISGAALPQVSS